MTEAIEWVLVYSRGTHDVYTDLPVVHDESGDAWLDANAATRWEEAYLAARARDAGEFHASTGEPLAKLAAFTFGQGNSHTPPCGSGGSRSFEFPGQGPPRLVYG